MYGIVSTVAECDLQLSRHMDLTGNGEQVLCRRLRIWLHIECFALLNTGERAHHDISRIVSASATAVDLAGDSFLHEDRNLLCFQVVELHGLTGGELHKLHTVISHCLGKKLQTFFRQVSACHSETQHVL